MSLQDLQNINESSPEQPTVDLLVQLQESIATVPKNQLDDLRTAVEQKQSELAGKVPATINRELENLRLRVQAANPTILEQAADIGDDALDSAEEALGTATEYGQKTLANLQKITLKEYTDHFANPHKSTTEKVLRYSGLALLGYSAYRVSRWFLSSSAKQQPKTFVGSVARKGWWLAKAMGLLGLSAFIVNKTAASQSSNVPVKPPVPVAPIQPPAPNFAPTTPTVVQDFLTGPVTIAGKNVELRKATSGVNVVINGVDYNLGYNVLVNSMLSSALQSAELQSDNFVHIHSPIGVRRVAKNDLEVAINAIAAGTNTVNLNVYNDQDESESYKFTVKKV